MKEDLAGGKLPSPKFMENLLKLLMIYKWLRIKRIIGERYVQIYTGWGVK